MKILCIGDVHGQFDSIYKAYNLENPDLILQVGDFAKQERGERRFDVGEYPERMDLKCPFIFVLGNHENLSNYYKFSDSRVALGFFGQQTYKGLKILGIGGIGGKTRPVHWGVNRALEESKGVQEKWPHILLTHDACSPYMKTTKSGNRRDVGSEELSWECKRLAPRLHLSGHHHHSSLEFQHGIPHLHLDYSARGYAVIDTKKDWEVRIVRYED